MITPQIQAAINHLQHLLDGQAEIQRVVLAPNGNADLTLKNEETNCYQKEERDLIQEVLNDVSTNPDICTDCMTDENMKSNPFFNHMMNAYIKNLIVGYGKYVPISRAMAMYFLKHDLLNGFTIYHKTTSGAVS